MRHCEIEQLHQYLAGALAETERAEVEAHLTGCHACSMALAEIAAEDALLTDSLALDAAERVWIESIDLVEPVMALASPRFRLTPPVVLTSLLMLAGGYLAGSIWSAGSGLLGDLPDIGAIITLIPQFFRFFAWLSGGGLLLTLWPALLIAALSGLWHLTRTKETNAHA